MNQQQRNKALLHVRLAIKGWAFNEKAIPGHIQRAEEEIAKLPESLRAEAEKLVTPLRKALQK